MKEDRCELLCLDLDVAEGIRARSLSAVVAARAAGRARALADPTRLAMAAALADAEELCVCDLAWITGRAQNLVSHHLRQLRSDGIASNRRDGRMVMYALTPVGRTLVAAVLASEQVTP